MPVPSPRRVDGGLIIMREVEKLQRQFNGILSEDDVMRRLEDVRRDIKREWREFKRYQQIMRGRRLKDNGIDMLLVFLIKRGILQ